MVDIIPVFSIGYILEKNPLFLSKYSMVHFSFNPNLFFGYILRIKNEISFKQDEVLIGSDFMTLNLMI